MSKKSIALMMFATLFLAGALAAHLPSTLCWASDRVSADPTFTLEATNEPLRGVLGKISRKTGWKIKSPEKWMEKQVTQTLNNVTIEQGLRFILRDVGVENLLLTYDENIKVVTVFDTETPKGRSANGPEVRTDVPSPVASTTVDPMLGRRATETEDGEPSPRTVTRARRRALSSREED